MDCFFDVILSMPTPPTKGGFRGGAAVWLHPPELLWRPPELGLAPPWAHLRGNLATPWERSWNRPPPICSPAPRVYFGTYCVCQNEQTVAVHLMCTQYCMENDTTITKAPCFPLLWNMLRVLEHTNGWLSTMCTEYGTDNVAAIMKVACFHGNDAWRIEHEDVQNVLWITLHVRISKQCMMS